jgi:hypothetical protein
MSPILNKASRTEASAETAQLPDNGFSDVSKSSLSGLSLLLSDLLVRCSASDIAECFPVKLTSEKKIKKKKYFPLTQTSPQINCAIGWGNGSPIQLHISDSIVNALWGANPTAETIFYLEGISNLARSKTVL